MTVNKPLNFEGQDLVATNFFLENILKNVQKFKRVLTLIVWTKKKKSDTVNDDYHLIIMIIHMMISLRKP